MPNAAVVSRRSASISRVNGTTGQQHGEAEADQPQLRRHLASVSGPATSEATRAATGIETASPVMPATSSPTRWVSRMYAAQQHAAASAKATPTGSASPVHGWVSSSTPAPASSGQVRRCGAASPGDRDAERAQELQRAGHAERQPGHRRHEQQGDAGDHDAEQHAGDQSGAGERTRHGRPISEHQDSRPAPAAARPRPRQPSRSISPTETASPSWTHSIEAIAISAPVRAPASAASAEVQGVGRGHGTSERRPEPFAST